MKRKNIPAYPPEVVARAIAMLHQDMPQKQIADVLGVSQPWVSLQRSKARKSGVRFAVDTIMQDAEDLARKGRTPAEIAYELGRSENWAGAATKHVRREISLCQ